MTLADDVPPADNRSPRPQRPRRFKAPRTVMALMLREMSTTYGRSPGGYIWAVVEPAAGILLFTVVIAYGLKIRAPSIGVSFALFYATGLLPFMMFQRISAKVAQSIQYSRPLLFYPGVTYVDAIAARFLLNLLTQLVILYVVFGGVILLFETRAMIELPAILLAIAMAASLGLGIGTLNGFLIPTFPLWGTIWGILTTPLVFISGIFYTFSDLPAVGRAVLWYNPLIHVTGAMRVGFYPTYQGGYVSPVYVFGIAAVTLAAGLLLLRRFHLDIMNR